MASTYSGGESGFLGRDSRRGDPLRADDMNAIKRALRRGRLTVDGADVHERSGGLALVPTRRGVARVAKSGGGGVPAISGSTPGSGTVTLYDFNGTTLAASDSVTAYNISTSAIGASKWLQLIRVGPYWFVMMESC